METSFWGPQTSYLNFCEEDYAITRYIAEFINTLSSLAYIAYGLYGLLSYPQFPTGSRLLLWCGLMGVGICSSAYHMTLKYHTQMSDELSMHLLTTPLVYRLITFKASPQRTMLIGTVLSSLFTLVMVTHVVLDEFVLHAVTFASGVLIVATQSPKMVSEHVPDPRTRQNLRNISLFGSSCFAFGWHIFTAIGSYTAVVVVDLVTLEEVVDDPTPHLAWPVPFVARRMAGPVEPSKAKAG
ncbi:hypothetical protein CDV31_015271 [Fusarium ambrosium]|uniref:Alkaline ceramidase 3 n=1 Tax=Fusarium ambrosium TaxID=131363 RepID=A0A428SQX3_9HYPO|nr:hypothetical protein CDV31_015271 [Fusarium ambrosium]